MSGKPSSSSLRIRNSEDKLYKACLDACIEGIENLQVSKRRAGSATPQANDNTIRAATSTVKPEPPTSLLSPPPSPSASTISSLRSPPPPPTTSTTTMNRSLLHGAPPQGPRGAPPRGLQGAPPAWGSQDARSNLAVQPAANTGNFKLKKNAVKIVGAAVPMSNAPQRTSAPAPPMASSPAPGPVKAKPKEAEGHSPTKAATTPATPTPAPKAALSKTEIPKRENAAESDIDSMFARLTTKSPATPSRAPEGIALAGPNKAMFSFEDRLSAADTSKKTLKSYVANLPTTPTKPSQLDPVVIPVAAQSKTEQFKNADQLNETDKEQKADESNKEQESMSQEELEHEYLRKACEYVNALPDSKETTAYTIKVVSKKLRSSYIPDVKIDFEKNDILKARYAFAVINYVNQVLKKGAKPLTAESVKKILKDNDGNFLGLCATLVEDKYIALDSLGEILGLCKTVLDILPNPEPAIVPVAEETKPAVSKDPVDSMKAWPTQEKRENSASYRTCILKGVSGVSGINQLQALVWGGRLESISMPESGSDFALVKFLTPEACQKYFEATENGIEITGDRKLIIFVEKTAGPNSINDVIRNCIEGDASRCVRAVGVEDGWEDMSLMKLARGKDRLKREVDRIKRGKTARGHNYVEFRFANIYHALNFKRQLMDDEDWEHCTISYAQDPCETARGVHYKDEDEGGSGFFA